MRATGNNAVKNGCLKTQSSLSVGLKGLKLGGLWLFMSFICAFSGAYVLGADGMAGGATNIT